MKTVVSLLKNETVLVISLLLAVISMFLVPPWTGRIWDISIFARWRCCFV